MSRNIVYYIVAYIVISLILSGCNFLEVKVEVAQRSIMDNGDGSEDSFSKGDSRTEVDETETIIRTIP